MIITEKTDILMGVLVHPLAIEMDDPDSSGKRGFVLPAGRRVIVIEDTDLPHLDTDKDRAQAAILARHLGEHG